MFHAVKVQIFPDASIRFWILDFGFQDGLQAIQNRQSKIQNQDVSETQTAECRSSKPNVAGSIPVAHSKFFDLI